MSGVPSPHQNMQVAFKPDEQERINSLDVKRSPF
jgi:hypothetical protein